MNYIDFPTFRNPTSMTFGLNGLSTVFSSPAGATQAIARTALWKGTFKWEVLTEDDWRIMRAFMGKMVNADNVAVVKNVAYTPAGSHPGTPVIDGAGQTGGYTLKTKGWTASQTGVLKAGDYITLTTKQMLMITDDANSDASGNATLNVSPYIRTAVVDGSAIECVTPSVVMRMPGFAAPASVEAPIIAAMSFDMLEVLL